MREVTVAPTAANDTSGLSIGAGRDGSGKKALRVKEGLNHDDALFMGSEAALPTVFVKKKDLTIVSSLDTMFPNSIS